jgi:hypothetical protein
MSEQLGLRVPMVDARYRRPSRPSAQIWLAMHCRTHGVYLSVITSDVPCHGMRQPSTSDHEMASEAADICA